VSARFLNIEPVIANILSYSFGILCGFFLNSKWTFSAGPRFGATQRLARYAAVNLSSFALSTLIIAVTTHYTSALVAKLASIPATFLWNFCAHPKRSIS
jgi:putative flippase GtrA